MLKISTKRHYVLIMERRTSIRKAVRHEKQENDSGRRGEGR